LTGYDPVFLQLNPPDGDAALSIQGRKSPVIGAPV